MLTRFRILSLVALTVLAVGPASATSLFPSQTGDWAVYEAMDALENTWSPKLEIMEQVSINGKNYYSVHFSNITPEGGEADRYVRFTSNAWFIPYNVTDLTPDGEYLLFQAAEVGTFWEVPSPGGSVEVNQYKKILSIEEITVPYGTFTAYKQYDYYVWKDAYLPPGEEPGTEHILSYDYLVVDNPALGWIMSVNYNIDDGSGPHTWKLAEVHIVPLPSSLLLLGSGLLGLGAVGWGRGRKE